MRVVKGKIVATDRYMRMLAGLKRAAFLSVSGKRRLYSYVEEIPFEEVPLVFPYNEINEILPGELEQLPLVDVLMPRNFGR